jgi:hypothetical protein|tara:strand:+ start:227 stop:946 length:720 start_codon:yes stop_codon:yes gene_type:complete
MGLRAGDLKDLVYKVFEIDSYKSKMGNDADIVVLSFTVNEKQPATDLVEFIEKGYSFVLDADVSSGEQEDGMYRVFVEIERDKHVPQQIVELLDGVAKLAGRDDFRFRYYKSFKSEPVSIDALEAVIPIDNEAYEITVTESNMNNFKNFFNRSFLETIDLDEEQELIIKKAYADPVGFKVKDFGETTEILESIEDKINMNDFAEIIFLTKYVGDYNVTKFGKKTLTFENAGYTLVVERL